MDNLVFKFLDKENIDEIYNLTTEVYEGIENKEIFSHDSKEYLEDVIDNGGAFIGVYDDNKLVAYRSIKVPHEDEDYVSKFNFYVDPNTVLVNDTVVVLKDYRGRNLQNITRERIGEKYEGSKFTNKIGTVSPNNYYSYKNTLVSGYKIVSLEEKYPDEFSEEGYDRFIILKSEDIQFNFTGREKIISCEDLERIKKAISENFYGVSVDGDGNILFKEAEVK